MKKSVVLLLLLIGLKSAAQGKEGFQITVTHENDFLTINNDDENYTGGLKIEGLFPEIKWKWLPFIKYKGETVLNINRMGMGATAYTPQDLARADVISDDRPYASLVFLNFGNNSYNTERNEMIQSELVLGLIGTSIPGNAQAYLHEHHWGGSQRPIPLGWDNQIGYNGSLLLNYNTRFQKELFSTQDKNPKFKLLIANGVGKIDVGNYMINLQGGMKFSFININSGVLQDNYINSNTLVKQENALVKYEEQKRKFRMSLFAEPNIRIVGYNATLEGLLFSDHSAYKIDHSAVNRVLFEINAGVNLTFCDWLYLRYSHFGRSKEFAGGKSFHNWGAVTVGFSPSKWHYK